MEEDKNKKNNADEKTGPVPDVSMDALSVCQKERDEYLNGWKRAKAELINYQKDESKRIEDATNFTSARLISDFLPILDSFDLALASANSDPGFQKGLSLIQGQYLDVLKRRGVERIPVKSGDDFNSLVHEAVGEVELSTEQKNLSGKIFEELSAGYTYKGRVIRAVKVKLGR